MATKKVRRNVKKVGSFSLMVPVGKFSPQFQEFDSRRPRPPKSFRHGERSGSVPLRRDEQAHHELPCHRFDSLSALKVDSMDFSLFRSWWSFLPDLRPVDDFKPLPLENVLTGSAPDPLFLLLSNSMTPSLSALTFYCYFLQSADKDSSFKG